MHPQYMFPVAFFYKNFTEQLVCVVFHESDVRYKMFRRQIILNLFYFHTKQNDIPKVFVKRGWEMIVLKIYKMKWHLIIPYKHLASLYHKSKKYLIVSSICAKSVLYLYAVFLKYQFGNYYLSYYRNYFYLE